MRLVRLPNGTKVQVAERERNVNLIKYVSLTLKVIINFICSVTESTSNRKVELNITFNNNYIIHIYINIAYKYYFTFFIENSVVFFIK